MQGGHNSAVNICFRMLLHMAVGVGLLACDGTVNQSSTQFATNPSPKETNIETPVNTESGQQQTVEDAPVEPPVRAPNFALPDATHRYVTLVDRKKPAGLVMVFVNTKTIDKVDAVELEKLNPERFPVIIIDRSESKKNALIEQRYIIRFANVKVYFDTEGIVANRYSVESIPTVVLINDEGTYVRRIPL